jgi:hypothetical protein
MRVLSPGPVIGVNSPRLSEDRRTRAEEVDAAAGWTAAGVVSLVPGVTAGVLSVTEAMVEICGALTHT